MRALAAVLLLGACATPAATQPSISMSESGAGAPGSVCGTKPELAHGAVPVDARVITILEMSSDTPRSLRAFEDLARLKALEVCATNVSLLRAVDDDGRGILAVTAALWERVPQPAP